jgi:hypothetical protein
MHFRLIFTVLLIFLILVSCAPSVTALPPAPVDLTSIPTPTPFSAPGSSHSQGDAWMEAYQDFEVGSTYHTTLHKGEKAYLDQDNNILEILDVQGRVMLENLGGYRYRFYAWEDGYNRNVCNGACLLQAGYSYTQNELAVIWENEFVEVRSIADDHLIGNILLNNNGLEAPIASVDVNRDGLVNVQELDSALSSLRQGYPSIVKSQPTLAAKYKTEVESATILLRNGDIHAAYDKIKGLSNEIAAATNDDRSTQVCMGVVIAAGFLLFVVIWLAIRQRSIGSRQRIEATYNAHSKGARQNAPVTDLEKTLERTKKVSAPFPYPIKKQANVPTSAAVCSVCGSPVSSTDKFCVKCGNRLV